MYHELFLDNAHVVFYEDKCLLCLPCNFTSYSNSHFLMDGNGVCMDLNTISHMNRYDVTTLAPFHQILK
jgi:hypothetical protein